MNVFITWPAQARALSKYNLVILNTGGEVRRSTTSEIGGADFVTVSLRSERRNYWGHQTGKTEENSAVI